MARKALSAPAAPFYYEAQDLSLVPTGSPPTLDIPLGNLDGDKINGIELMGMVAVTTTLNVLFYLRPNGINITGDALMTQRYRTDTAVVQSTTSSTPAPGYNMTLSGFVIASTDWNHSGDLWFRATVFTRTGSYRHSMSEYGSQDGAALNSLMSAELRSNWRDTTTKVTSLQLRLQASSGFTAATIRSLVARSF